MGYRIEFDNKARREFLDLSKEIQNRIASMIDDLGKDPRPPGAKKLQGTTGYRVRKGDYRVLYVIDDQEKIVRIYRVGHRREVYR